jgi:hypothetical protein
MMKGETSSVRLRAALLAALAAGGAFHGACRGAERSGVAITIDVSSPTASFVPEGAFGAGLDGLGKDETARVYTPGNIRAMAGAAYNRLSYRLRTELAVEAWHWNEAGAWSDPENRRGYWTSSSMSGKPLNKSYGYRLPRRGNTFDQAGNDGYSRLNDGDEATFWKSNPYLDAHFTGESGGLHPQWLVIDLGGKRRVNALRVLWGEPYAVRFEAQYWDGKNVDYVNDLGEGVWRPFERSRFEGGKGGDAVLRLSGEPVSVRYVRVLLLASSGTAAEGSTDLRDRLGYAIREIYAGFLDRKGRFSDAVRHGPSNKTQSRMIVSSTDPWHRESDLNPNSEQTGFDAVIATGLHRGRPILTPVAMLYDTPENAAAQIRFLKSRGYPMKQIELGEEPDGQHAAPEHYGALYLQFARAVHDVDPSLITGGPGFQSEVEGWNAFADGKGERSWMKRFVSYLRERGRLGDFGFFSFEWYPFDDMCEPPVWQLIEHPELMVRAFKRLDADGVPRNIPWIITEYGYSSFAGRAEVELPAAILNAEIVAQFLTLGGRAAYYYGLEPNTPIRELEGCRRHPDRLWGNLMMIQAGPDGQARWRLPAYYGAKMLVEEWAGRTGARRQTFRLSILEGAATPDEVSAYAVRRPDESWALLVLNKGGDRRRLSSVRFRGADGGGADWSGPLDVIQYSPRQFVWKANGANGRPARSEPPVRFRSAQGRPLGIELPPQSLTVVRGPVR